MLAWAKSSTGFCIASPTALSYGDDEDWKHIGWHEIEHGSWNAELQRLSWVLHAAPGKPSPRGSLEFDGRPFRPAGFPQPVDPLFLRRVGEHDGVPIFVSDTASPPYTDFWMPRCDGENVFELFIEGGPSS